MSEERSFVCDRCEHRMLSWTPEATVSLRLNKLTRPSDSWIPHTGSDHVYRNFDLCEPCLWIIEQVLEGVGH